MPKTINNTGNIEYDKVLCSHSEECDLMEKFLNVVNDSTEYSMSERRRFREILNELELEYCNNDSNREDCPVLRVRGKK